MPAPASVPPASPASAPSVRPGLAGAVLGAVLLAFAVLLAWGNSFHGPFVLDDLPGIAENPSIRQWSTALNPPNNGETVTGRPLVNLSFALNHQLAGRDPLVKDKLSGEPGDEVFGYHALNLAIHLGAALVLFGLVRRALAGPVLREKFLGGSAGGFALGQADGIAFAIALLWAVHPLQTESVTYIAQRAESLCGLFYLLTLWCLARGAESARPWRWLAAGVAACLCGMASKEYMASAPLLALLFDRAFFAGSFGGALRRRGWFYAGLVASWGLLAGLVWHSGTRGHTAGFGLGASDGQDLTWWTYLLRQCAAIVQYLRLSVWPGPLISDYGFDVVKNPAEVWPQGLLLLALFGATLWALWRRPAWGFLGVWFFAILAPSSSFIPVGTETAAEHRMYLPLAAAVVAAVLAAYALARRLGRAGLAGAALAGLAAAVALGAATHRRNDDYKSSLSLWQDAVAKRPQNARAHEELALAFSQAGRIPESLAESREALRILPAYATALNNYASTLEDAANGAGAAGKSAEAASLHAEAADAYAAAVRQKPGLAEAHLGLGNALANLGRLTDAVICFQNAFTLNPGLLIAGNNLGQALDKLGRSDEAVTVLQGLLAAHPDYPEAHSTLATILGNHGHLDDAIAHYRACLRLRPGDQPAGVNLGAALFLSGHKAEAIAQLEDVLRLAPDNADARAKLATIRASAP